MSEIISKSGYQSGSTGSPWGLGGDTLNLGGSTSATSGTTAGAGGGLTPASLATPSVFNPSGNEAFGMANWGGFMPHSELASYLQNPTQATSGSTISSTTPTSSTATTGGTNIMGDGAISLGGSAAGIK